MSVFKCAYARGVAEKLAREGIVKFASAEEAEKIADEVGLKMDHEPVTDGPIPVDKTAALIVAIMEKAAAGGTGTLVGTGDKAHENTPEHAAQHSSLAALDQKQRAQGTYVKGEKGVGQTDQPTHMVGKEMKQPAAPKTTDHKSNTVAKAAEDLSSMIKKIAEGNLIQGGDKKQENTPQEAAQSSSLAALDQKQRPATEYAKGEHGVGKSDQPTAPVGKEEDHPKAPGTTDHKSNSAVEQSHKSAAFMQLFEETAKKHIAKLASLKDDNEKVAAVKRLMTMDEEEAANFFKASSELPMALEAAKEQHEKKETAAEEHSEHKEVEEKEEQKKEARHGRHYVDPYGYKGRDSDPKGYKVQNYPSSTSQPEKRANALFDSLRGLAKK